MQEKYLYLIRHAESEGNKFLTNCKKEDMIIYGRSPWSELSTTGIDQAKKIGKHLLDNYLNKNVIFDRIIVSPAVRTQQTARYAIEIMFTNKWVKYDMISDLIEMDQGEWEGELDIVARPPEIKKIMNEESWNFRPPNGESQDDVYNRARKIFNKEFVNTDHSHTLVFTHASFIKFFLAGILGWEKENAYKYEVPNISIHILKNNKNNQEKWQLHKIENI